MKVYRITKKQYANLDGEGGLLYPGRWHNKGHRVLYTSENKSLAILELLAHINKVVILSFNFVLLEIIIPDEIPIETVPDDILNKEWNSFTFSRKCQNYGSEFLAENKGLILKVPSVIVPNEYNYIINPNHPDFNKIRLDEVNKFYFDTRLFKEK